MAVWTPPDVGKDMRSVHRAAELPQRNASLFPEFFPQFFDGLIRFDPESNQAAALGSA